MPKKAAGPAFDPDPAVCGELGFQAGDMVLTPLGAQVTVLGAKTDAEGTLRLWAQFPDGTQSPLGPTSSDQFHKQGYQRVHEGQHILRNTKISEEKRKGALEEVDWSTVMSPEITEAIEAMQSGAYLSRDSEDAEEND